MKLLFFDERMIRLGAGLENYINIKCEDCKLGFKESLEILKCEQISEYINFDSMLIRTSLTIYGNFVYRDEVININNQNTLVYPDVFGCLDSKDFKIKKLWCDFLEIKIPNCNIVNFNKLSVLLPLTEIKFIIFDTNIYNDLKYNDFKNNLISLISKINGEIKCCKNECDLSNEILDRLIFKNILKKSTFTALNSFYNLDVLGCFGKVMVFSYHPLPKSSDTCPYNKEYPARLYFICADAVQQIFI